MHDLDRDQRLFSWIAGIAAMLSSAAWITWAVLNGLTHGGMEMTPPAASVAFFKAAALLTAAWNLFLIPCALALWRWLKPRRPDLMLLYTVCGVLSLVFWAYGGMTHTITPALESSYVLMSAVWWTGTGFVLWQESKAVGLLTIILGMFAALDFALSLFEPLPDYMFAVAAPKLPLAALWSMWIGIVLVKRSRSHLAVQQSLAASTLRR